MRGIAVDPDGKFLYVAANHFIYKLSPQLAILARFGGPGTTGGDGNGGLIEPWDIDVDGTHGAWVSDAQSNLIQYFFYP